jgi:hypothetical protein
MANEQEEQKMVTAKKLLELLWDEESRPSIQWLRQHTGVDIPAVRVGRLYFYHPNKVRTALQLA